MGAGRLGYSLIWHIRGCVAGQGRFLTFLSQRGSMISHKSALHRVYNLQTSYFSVISQLSESDADTK